MLGSHCNTSCGGTGDDGDMDGDRTEGDGILCIEAVGFCIQAHIYVYINIVYCGIIHSKISKV